MGAGLLVGSETLDLGAQFGLAVEPAAMDARGLGDRGEGDGLAGAVEAA